MFGFGGTKTEKKRVKLHVQSITLPEMDILEEGELISVFLERSENNTVNTTEKPLKGLRDNKMGITYDEDLQVLVTMKRQYNGDLKEKICQISVRKRKKGAAGQKVGADTFRIIAWVDLDVKKYADITAGKESYISCKLNWTEKGKDYLGKGALLNAIVMVEENTDDDDDDASTVVSSVSQAKAKNSIVDTKAKLSSLNVIKTPTKTTNNNNNNNAKNNSSSNNKSNNYKKNNHDDDEEEDEDDDDDDDGDSDDNPFNDKNNKSNNKNTNINNSNKNAASSNTKSNTTSNIKNTANNKNKKQESSDDDDDDESDDDEEESSDDDNNNNKNKKNNNSNNKSSASSNNNSNKTNNNTTSSSAIASSKKNLPIHNKAFFLNTDGDDDEEEENEDVTTNTNNNKSSSVPSLPFPTSSSSQSLNNSTRSDNNNNSNNNRSSTNYSNNSNNSADMNPFNIVGRGVTGVVGNVVGGVTGVVGGVTGAFKGQTRDGGNNNSYDGNDNNNDNSNNNQFSDKYPTSNEPLPKFLTEFKERAFIESATKRLNKNNLSNLSYAEIHILKLLEESRLENIRLRESVINFEMQNMKCQFFGSEVSRIQDNIENETKMKNLLESEVNNLQSQCQAKIEENSYLVDELIECKAKRDNYEKQKNRNC